MAKERSTAALNYIRLLGQIKTRIREAQTRAVFAANAEMIRLYWDVGHMVLRRQQMKGWGASVIPRLARDICNELPEVKGFSERNIGYMIRFAKEYPILQQPAAKLPSDSDMRILHQPGAKSPSNRRAPILQQPVAKLTESTGEEFAKIVFELPWGHNIVLLEKVVDLPTRLWYMRQTLQNGWSRNILSIMIDSEFHKRHGKAITNFKQQLPPTQSDLSISKSARLR